MKTFKSFASLVFAIASLVVIISISLGIRFDFERIKTLSFWTEVGIKWALTMVLFNIAFLWDKENRIHDKNGRFFLAFATLKIKIGIIHGEKLYNQLDTAIKEKNEKNIKALWEQKIHKYCAHISYDDIFKSEKTPSELADFYRIKKHKKRFLRICEDIRQGVELKRFGVKVYHPLKEEFFLKDDELSKISNEVFDYSGKKETAKRNIKKSFIFIGINIIGAILSYSFLVEDIWGELITILFTAFSALISGFAYAKNDVGFKTQVYENRNDFLERYLNISDKYEKG